VQLQGAGDPLLELVSDTVVWTATVTGGRDVPAVGAELVWIVDGVEVGRVPVTTDPFTDTRPVDAPPEGARVRLQLEVEGAPRVLTAYQWVADAPATEPPPEEGCGCGVVPGPAAPARAPATAALGALLVLTAARRRR